MFSTLPALPRARLTAVPSCRWFWGGGKNWLKQSLGTSQLPQEKGHASNKIHSTDKK